MSDNEATLIDGVMNVMHWMTTLVYLNILWIIGVLAGGVVLGIAPATLSMCAVFKELIWNRRDVPLAATFITKYRSIWKESNKFIFLFYGIFLFLWVDYRLIMAFAPYIFPAYVLLSLFLLLAACYFFVFYDVFDKPLKKKLLDSLLFPWLFPVQSLGMLAGVGGMGLVVIRFPGVAVLFLVSTPFALFYYVLRKKYWRNFRVK